MPLFFLISGYLNNEKRNLSLLKKNVRSLIKPAYSILGFDILISLAQCVLGMEQWPDLRSIMETLILYKGCWKNYPIWFLMTLFVCKSITLILGKTGSGFIAIIGAAVCAFGINEQLSVFWLFTTISAMPFFIIGIFMKNRQLPTIGKTKEIVIIVSWVLLALFNGQIDMYQQENGRQWILFALTGVLGTCIVIYISKWFELHKNKISLLFVTLGRNSLIILVTHYYWCRIILPKLLQAVNLNILYNSIVFQILMTAIVVEVYAYLFIRREKNA